jgi:hypothetical protein
VSMLLRMRSRSAQDAAHACEQRTPQRTPPKARPRGRCLPPGGSAPG